MPELEKKTNGFILCRQCRSGVNNTYYPSVSTLPFYEKNLIDYILPTTQMKLRKCKEPGQDQTSINLQILDLNYRVLDLFTVSPVTL